MIKIGSQKMREKHKIEKLYYLKYSINCFMEYSHEKLIYDNPDEFLA